MAHFLGIPELRSVAVKIICKTINENLDPILINGCHDLSADLHGLILSQLKNVYIHNWLPTLAMRCTSKNIPCSPLQALEWHATDPCVLAGHTRDGKTIKIDTKLAKVDTELVEPDLGNLLGYTIILDERQHPKNKDIVADFDNKILSITDKQNNIQEYGRLFYNISSVSWNKMRPDWLACSVGKYITVYDTKKKKSFPVLCPLNGISALQKVRWHPTMPDIMAICHDEGIIVADLGLCFKVYLEIEQLSFRQVIDLINYYDSVVMKKNKLTQENLRMLCFGCPSSIRYTLVDNLPGLSKDQKQREDQVKFIANLVGLNHHLTSDQERLLENIPNYLKKHINAWIIERRQLALPFTSSGFATLSPLSKAASEQDDMPPLLNPKDNSPVVLDTQSHQNTATQRLSQSAPESLDSLRQAQIHDAQPKGQKEIMSARENSSKVDAKAIEQAHLASTLTPIMQSNAPATFGAQAHLTPKELAENMAEELIANHQHNLLRAIVGYYNSFYLFSNLNDFVETGAPLIEKQRRSAFYDLSYSRRRVGVCLANIGKNSRDFLTDRSSIASVSINLMMTHDFNEVVKYLGKGAMDPAGFAENFIQTKPYLNKISISELCVDIIRAHIDFQAKEKELVNFKFFDQLQSLRTDMIKKETEFLEFCLKTGLLRPYWDNKTTILDWAKSYNIPVISNYLAELQKKNQSAAQSQSAKTAQETAQPPKTETSAERRKRLRAEKKQKNVVKQAIDVSAVPASVATPSIKSQEASSKASNSFAKVDTTNSDNNCAQRESALETGANNSKEVQHRTETIVAEQVVPNASVSQTAQAHPDASAKTDETIAKSKKPKETKSDRGPVTYKRPKKLMEVFQREEARRNLSKSNDDRENESDAWANTRAASFYVKKCKAKVLSAWKELALQVKHKRLFAEKLKVKRDKRNQKRKERREQEQKIKDDARKQYELDRLKLHDINVAVQSLKKESDNKGSTSTSTPAATVFVQAPDDQKKDKSVSDAKTTEPNKIDDNDIDDWEIRSQASSITDTIEAQEFVPDEHQKDDDISDIFRHDTFGDTEQTRAAAASSSGPAQPSATLLPNTGKQVQQDNVILEAYAHWLGRLEQANNRFYALDNNTTKENAQQIKSEFDKINRMLMSLHYKIIIKNSHKLKMLEDRIAKRDLP